MGRIDKWSEHQVQFAGQRQMARFGLAAMSRVRILLTQSVVPVTGLTVNYGGGTGFFDLHIDGWWCDQYECVDNRMSPVGTTGSLSFVITPLATVQNTVRWLIWGR